MVITMQQYNPVYKHPDVKNKSATASFVLSIISISFLLLAIPFFIISMVFFSMAGQSPEASGVYIDNPEAMEEYYGDSRNLRITGTVFLSVPTVLSGVTALPGQVFGIIGVMKPGKRGQAVAGIIMSGIPICIGIMILLFELL